MSRADSARSTCSSDKGAEGAVIDSNVLVHPCTARERLVAAKVHATITALATILTLRRLAENKEEIGNSLLIHGPVLSWWPME